MGVGDSRRATGWPCPEWQWTAAHPALPSLEQVLRVLAAASRSCSLQACGPSTCAAPRCGGMVALTRDAPTPAHPRSPPFYGAGTQQIFRAILHDSLDLASPPWDSVSAAAKDCVRRMLVRDPRKRATARCASVVQHSGEWTHEVAWREARQADSENSQGRLWPMATSSGMWRQPAPAAACRLRASISAFAVPPNKRPPRLCAHTRLLCPQPGACARVDARERRSN